MLRFKPTWRLSIPARDPQNREGRSPPNCAFYMERSNPRLGIDGPIPGPGGKYFQFQKWLRSPGGLGVKLVSKPRSCGARVCSAVAFRAIELPSLPKGQRSRPPKERVLAAYYCKKNLVSTKFHRRASKPFHGIHHQMEYRGIKYQAQARGRFGTVAPWQWLERPIGTHVA